MKIIEPSVLQLRQRGLRRRDHRRSSLHFCRHRLPLPYLEAVVQERRGCLLRSAERGLQPAGSSICPSEQPKTEVVMTADLREWRHFCKLRCAPAAHPDMRIVANMLLTLLKQTYPVFFEDIES